MAGRMLGSNGRGRMAGMAGWGGWNGRVSSSDVLAQLGLKAVGKAQILAAYKWGGAMPAKLVGCLYLFITTFFHMYNGKCIFT